MSVASMVGSSLTTARSVAEEEITLVFCEIAIPASYETERVFEAIEIPAELGE